MSSYFDEEDTNYDSDESKSLANEDIIFSKSKTNKVGRNKSITANIKGKENMHGGSKERDEEDIEDEEDVEDVDLDADEDDDDDDDDDDDIEDDDVDIVEDLKKKIQIPTFDYENQLDIDDVDEEDEDEDEDEDEMYIKKFDQELNRKYLLENHPESVIHNYDEIEAMSKIIRNKKGVIIDDFHKTIPYLTKYERTKILGQRAKQINSGAVPFIKVPEKILEGYTIAEMELKEKKMPFIIRRPLPNGGSEYWNVKDLEDISF